MESALTNVDVQLMSVHLDAAALPFAPQDAAEIITVLVIQHLDGIVGAFHGKRDVLVQGVGRAAPNAFLSPMILLIVCTVPGPFDDLTPAVILDSTLSCRFIEEKIFYFQRL